MCVVHERSYRGIHPFSFYHRARLRSVFRTMRSLAIPSGAALADYGCSNGFFLAELSQALPHAGTMSLYGFDHSADLLAAARSRKIENAEFDHVDLNGPPRPGDRSFDVVTCFETLEHVGDIQNAIETLLASCKPGGVVIISVPNEIGLPGLFKYITRKLFRRRPYEGFFHDQSEISYVLALLSGKPISVFRSQTTDGWGPHLGFDWRVVLNRLNESTSCNILRIDSLLFGYIIIARRI